MEFAKVAGCDIAAVLASLGIAIVLAYSGWGYWALVARWVTAPIVMTACGWTVKTSVRWCGGLGTMRRFMVVTRADRW